jgi:Domain of unknown function (DUF4430)
MLRRTGPARLAAAFALAIALGGCGFGAGRGTKDASVQVTSNFGSHLIGRAVESKVPGSETVMSLTQRHFNVKTRYGGGFVESIDGKSGGAGHLDWFYYVNGIEAPKGAGVTDVHKGDHIWWDLHNWTAVDSIPAVVGSYPEPFTNGSGGKEFPTLIDCAPNTQKACDMIGTSLHKAGVKAADQGFGTGSGSDSLAVVVGTWRQIQGVVAAELIAGGPKSSGVYAQFVGRAGKALELDNASGGVAKALYGNAGLIAATEEVSLGQPTWFVTGTDAAGVSAAARAFTAGDLHDHFAIAVKGPKIIPLPVVRGS